MSMTLEDKVKVIAAALNGDEVEYRDSGYDDIWGACHDPAFDSFNRGEYRIKPQPKEIWVNEYEGGTSLHISEDIARNAALRTVQRVAVHYREVV